MRWQRAALLFGVMMLGVGCATAPRLTPAERLEFYRANSGDPVRSFSVPGRLWGWRAVGDGALTVWTRSNRGFLVELHGRCPELPFAQSIGLTNRAGSVSAGFDSVVVPQRGSAARPVSCRIDTIRPLQTQSVKESKRELHEVDPVERDPALPEEPGTIPDET